MTTSKSGVFAGRYKARAQNPAIEPFFAEDAAEPVVVKNLETVQGDERDLVLLGIGYGPETPDAPTMPMNFGPLNRAGGWRRLNVAITSARREMVVYTSFPPTMIDLNRTSSEALRDLKHFLQFAEQGPRTLGQVATASVEAEDSPFEDAVARGLRKLGWEIVPQVGVSRYRIDLGIVHPDRPGDYLAGVECDGSMYRSAATARDRDKVREAVLSQLGWKLLRVWSTDWWIDRDSALQQLQARLEALLAARREADRQADREEEQKRLEQEALRNDQLPSLAEPEEQPIQGLPQPEPAPGALQQGLYRATAFETELLQPDQFFEPMYSSHLAQLIAKIVHQESPIKDDILVERIDRAHGFLRSGTRIRERVLSLVKAGYYLLAEEGGATFIWPDSDTAASWALARYPATDEDCRTVEDIALIELAAAFPKVDASTFVIQVARNFGAKRPRIQARQRLEQAAALASSRA